MRASYADAVAAITAPPTEHLLAGCATLQALGRRPRPAPPEEIAFTEFAYYLVQTHAYEAVGLAILESMRRSALDASMRDTFVAQLGDERRHVEVYEQALIRLVPAPLRGALAVDARAITTAVGGGSLAEQVVVSFCVLESLAMGIFGARQRCYPDSGIARVDRLLLEDETVHQRVGVALVARMVEDGLVTYADVIDMVEAGAGRVARLLRPRYLLERFDLADDPGGERRLLDAGLVREQRVITQRAVRNALRSVRRAAIDSLWAGARAS